MQLQAWKEILPPYNVWGWGQWGTYLSKAQIRGGGQSFDPRGVALSFNAIGGGHIKIFLRSVDPPDPHVDIYCYTYFKHACRLLNRLLIERASCIQSSRQREKGCTHVE